MNTYFPTRGARGEPRRPVRVMARDGPAEGRREQYLDWAGAFMYLLAGGAFVTAGAFVCKFVLLISFRAGALLSLVFYVAAAAAAWLAGRYDPDL